ncbi:MAG: alpha/beta hydrolase [Acidobacteriaceae bacterium]|nr:alpha/beta hydrolase [Acidobacteriaceae bacterium]
MTSRLLLALALFSATLTANAQNPFLDAPNDGHIGVPLWPAGAPGALGTAASDIPTLTAYLPVSNPAHTAVIVVPGGGYSILALNHEGAQIGVWLASHGIAAFIVKYRLGPRYHHPIELEDAQRALRTVRAHAADYGVDKDHIGMWGFSAGGHLTSTAGTHFDSGNLALADPIEHESSRPDFMILAYPVITLTGLISHSGSTHSLLGDSPSPETLALLSNQLQVTAQTPPTFIFSTTDDPAVPVMNSVLFYQALVEHHVEAELHLFHHGKHGLGLAQDDPELKIWPTLLLHWLVANHWAVPPVDASPIPVTAATSGR